MSYWVIAAIVAGWIVCVAVAYRLFRHDCLRRGFEWSCGNRHFFIMLALMAGPCVVIAELVFYAVCGLANIGNPNKPAKW